MPVEPHVVDVLSTKSSVRLPPGRPAGRKKMSRRERCLVREPLQKG